MNASPWVVGGLLMDDQALLRYSRHLLLDGFDEAGQQCLLDARVLVVGAGGLGCPAAMYLAASGVGQLLVADDDVVELSNLQRQIGHATADVGRPKVLSLADRLRAINPGTNVVPLVERLQGERLAEQVAHVDLVLDCSDNFVTRQAINRASRMYGRPLVSGAAIRMEGQVGVFNRSAASPCYACLYGENSQDGAATCSGNGVLSPLVGVIGAMQAVEALKLLAGVGDPLDGRVLLFDAFTAEWRSVRLGKDPGCPVCSVQGTVSDRDATAAVHRNDLS